MVLGDVVYLGQLLGVMVMGVRVEADGSCSSGGMVLQDGMLHCGDGGGGSCGRCRLLDVDGLQSWGRCQVGSCWEALDLLGEELLLDVLLGCLLKLTVLFHLLWGEGDGLALQGCQRGVLLCFWLIFLQGLGSVPWKRLQFGREGLQSGQPLGSILAGLRGIGLD